MYKVYRRLALLIMLIGGISGAVIYFTVDIDTLRHLNVFKPWSIAVSLIFLGIGLFFDGTRLMHLVDISGEHINLLDAVQVVFSNYFLALLTPGAAGGAVAQVVFLRHAGVPIGKATVVVLVRTLLSIFFLLLCLPFIFSYDTGLLPWVSERVLMVGSIILIAFTIGLIWMLRTNAFDYIMIMCTKNLSHTRRRSIFAMYRDIRGAVCLLSAAPLSIVRVFFESALSLLALYTVVPVLFGGLGIHFNWLQVLGRMALLNLFLYFAPTPGGSGIAEGGFVLLFSSLLPHGIVGIMAVSWRFIVEYLPFMVGLYFTVRVFGRDFIKRKIS